MFEWIEEELEKMRGLGLLREPGDGALRGAVAERALASGDAFIDASSNDYLGYGRRSFTSSWCELGVDEDCCGGPFVSRETSETLGIGSEQMVRAGAPCPAGTGENPSSTALDHSTGACASRLLGGTRQAHTALEEAIADWLRQESSLLFSSGYAANVGLISSIAGQDDQIFSDALNHASIIDGCRLSRANVLTFPHRDVGHLRRLLENSPPARRRFVITESYFSMDGDSPDLVSLRGVADEFNATLIIDEAHALGVFGSEGSGWAAQSGVTPDIIVGTLGKAVGLQGAFVAGPKVVQRWLWNRARSFVYSTASIPLLARLGMLHVKHVRADDTGRRVVADRAGALRRCVQELGFPMPTGSHGPIVPVIVGANESAIAAAERLRAFGVLAYPLRPPTVPLGTARLRLTVAADTSERDFDRFLAVVRTALHPFAPPV